MSDESENFFKRWSKRKIAALSETGENAPLNEPENNQSKVVTHTFKDTDSIQNKEGVGQNLQEKIDFEATSEETDEELLTRLELPMPEQLKKGDDFAAFMRVGIPQRLRTRALRQLWRCDPVLANLDGLVDHGEDYTDAATVLPSLKTAYQAGKGYLNALKVTDHSVEGEKISHHQNDELKETEKTQNLSAQESDTPSSSEDATTPPVSDGVTTSTLKAAQAPGQQHFQPDKNVEANKQGQAQKYPRNRMKFVKKG